MSEDKQNLTTAFKRGLIFKFNFVGRIILDDYDSMAVQSWAWAAVTAVKLTLVWAPLFEPKATLKRVVWHQFQTDSDAIGLWCESKADQPLDCVRIYIYMILA